MIVPRLPASRMLLARALLFGLVVLGCTDVSAPPMPSGSRIPTIVGRIEGWGPNNTGYRLEGGQVVDIGADASTGAPAAKRLSSTMESFPDSDFRGGLLLAGEDADGRFYAATEPEADGCFEIHGQGYIEPGQVHLSSGLVLAFSTGFTRRNDRGYYDASWLLDFDLICLDHQGRITSIHQLPLGT